MVGVTGAGLGEDPVLVVVERTDQPVEGHGLSQPTDHLHLHPVLPNLQGGDPDPRDGIDLVQLAEESELELVLEEGEDGAGVEEGPLTGTLDWQR